MTIKRINRNNVGWFILLLLFGIPGLIGGQTKIEDAREAQQLVNADILKNAMNMYVADGLEFGPDPEGDEVPSCLEAVIEIGEGGGSYDLNQDDRLVAYLGEPLPDFLAGGYGVCRYPGSGMYNAIFLNDAP